MVGGWASWLGVRDDAAAESGGGGGGGEGGGEEYRIGFIGVSDEGIAMAAQILKSTQYSDFIW